MSGPKYTEAPRTAEQSEKLLRAVDEPGCTCPVHTNARRGWYRRNASWILAGLLGFTTLILAGQLYRHPRDKYQHTGDINGIAPHFTQRLQEFHPENKTTASIGHPGQDKATKAFWKSFAPDGFGLLNIKDYTPARYPQMHPPTEQAGMHLVDTSMAHQLHCLQSILEAYNDAASGISHHMARGAGHHDHSWHLGHCFDYIRQGIMCCGDTAIEGKAETFPAGMPGSDGWNTKHVCKDYGEVKGWIQKLSAFTDGYVPH